MKEDIKIESIITNINDLWGIDIRNTTRKTKYVIARIVFTRICRRKYGFSYQAIGNSVGKDHSTIVHCFNKYDTLIQYPEFVRLINRSLALYELPPVDNIPSENLDGLRHSVIQLQNVVKKMSEGIDPVLVELNALPKDKLREFKTYRAIPFLKMNKAM